MTTGDQRCQDEPNLLGLPVHDALDVRRETRREFDPSGVPVVVRQVLRTGREVVYAFAPDDTSQRRGSGPGVIRAYMATDRGVPRGFAEVDGAHRPGSTGTSVLYAPDVRLDRRGIAHLVYVDQAA